MLWQRLQEWFRVRVHCSCIYVWTHNPRSVSSWETAGALLETHITISVKANVQKSSSLPIFSSSDRHTRPVEELCKIMLFTLSYSEIMSCIVANGSIALSSVKQQAVNWSFWTRRPRLTGTFEFRKPLQLTKMDHAQTEPLGYKPQNAHRRCHLSLVTESRVWFEPQLSFRERMFSVWPNSHIK